MNTERRTNAMHTGTSNQRNMNNNIGSYIKTTAAVLFNQ